MRIFPDHVKGEKSPTKAEHSHKIADQLILTIDEEVSPKTMRVVDQGSVVIIMKTPHHAKWWRVPVTLPIKKVEINTIFVNISITSSTIGISEKDSMTSGHSAKLSWHKLIFVIGLT